MRAAAGRNDGHAACGPLDLDFAQAEREMAHANEQIAIQRQYPGRPVPNRGCGFVFFWSHLWSVAGYMIAKFGKPRRTFMKQFSLGCVALGALVGSAGAADLRARMPTTPPIAPVFSWSGCYIGDYLGGAWNDRNAAFTDLGNSRFASYSGGVTAARVLERLTKRLNR